MCCLRSVMTVVRDVDPAVVNGLVCVVTAEDSAGCSGASCGVHVYVTDVLRVPPLCVVPVTVNGCDG